MSGRSWTAPGKLMLLGEYGVLEGGRALVAAVDRRGRGALGPGTPAPSAVVEAVLALAERRGRARPIGVSIDTEALKSDGVKLGLGSSAVTAVLTAALALDKGDEETLELAITGHRAAASGAGSGVDVAASFYGGVLAASHQPGPLLVLPCRIRGLHLTVIASQVAASTPELVARAQSAPRWRAHAAELSRLAEEGIAAWARPDVPRFLSVVARYKRAMAALGRDAGVAIVDAAAEEIARLAGQAGAAAKPSGAGGGDVTVVFATDPEVGPRIAEKVGAKVVPLAVDPRGLAQETYSR